MSKMLSDKNLGEIINRAINDQGVIECQDAYIYFLEALANLVCDHFGGIRGDIEHSDNSFSVPIFVNECVPYDGGVFKDYDTKVTWKDGIEHRC